MSYDWEKSAFVVSPQNVPVTNVPDYIDTLFIQIAWGTGLPNPPISQDRLDLLRQHFRLGGWAWCVGLEIEEEAAWHAEQIRVYGVESFVANMEEGYDAHGNQADARYTHPGEYFEVLIQAMPNVPLGVTTTPKFGSDMTRWVDWDAIYMPQAFPLENFATVEVVVEHGMDWGWPIDQIRPLVQTYQTNNIWPNVVKMNNEAALYGVGVTPYTIEQACLQEGGMEILAALQPSIIRPNPPPPEEEDYMIVIGSQHGIVAAYNRLKTMDPGGCNPAFDPNNYNALPVDQLKAWDKWARTMMILRENNDEQATGPSQG